MIPPSFDYARPSSVDEAVAELARAGEDGKVLAGGQSLLPLLRLRLSYPSTVVDVGRIEQLRGVRLDGDALVIGAMTTHHDVLHDPLVAEHCPVLAQATATVADRAVRNRGTFGGSLAHADPAADLPAVALALDAEMVLAGTGGQRRTVPAGEFFRDYLETAIGPGELLVEVRVPRLGPGRTRRPSRRWSGSRPRTAGSPRRPGTPPTTPSPRRTCPAGRTTAGTSPRCSPDARSAAPPPPRELDDS